MKILQVIPCYLPAHRYGGPVKSVHELSRKLVELGAEVTVYTTNADGPETLGVPTDRACLLDGVKVHYFPVEKPRSYFRSTCLNRALQDRVHHFDLVHINWLYVYPTLAAARHCLRQKVPYLLAPRGMLDPNAIAMKGALKKKLYLHLLEKKHLCGSKGLHFTSRGERDQAAASGWALPSYVVGNGLDLDAYGAPPETGAFGDCFPETQGKRLVLFLGRLNFIKGLDLLARAWPQVVREIPEAHLVLAGPDDDGYGEKVRGWLKAGGVLQSVTFAGMLTGAEKLAALAAAEVFVASSYLESFGMAIVEAMACKKPVVVTDRVNISPEIKEAQAGLVTACDPEEISRALVRLLQDPENAHVIGENGYRLVERRFTWDMAATEMLRVYAEILETL